MTTEGGSDSLKCWMGREKQMGRWTDMSPCRELISQYTKSFDMTGEDMTRHDTVSHELLL